MCDIDEEVAPPPRVGRANFRSRVSHAAVLLSQHIQARELLGTEGAGACVGFEAESRLMCAQVVVLPSLSLAK